MNSRTNRLFVAVFAVAVLAGCNRHPCLTPDQIVAQFPGKRVPLEGNLAPVWTFGARSPTRVTILESEYEGKTASLIVEVRAQSTPGSDTIVRARGRLRLGFEWIAGEWSLLRVDNLTFQQVRTDCARALPPEATPTRAQDLSDELLAHTVIPSITGSSLTYGAIERGDDTAIVRACKNLTADATIGGRVEVLARVPLRDGRMAAALSTGSFEGGSGRNRRGFLALFTIDDRLVVADALGAWEAPDGGPVALRAEQLAGETVLVEPVTDQVVGEDPTHQERVWIERAGVLRDAGNVPIDGKEDFSCSTTGGPWLRRFTGRSTFAGDTITVRDDVTWERGSCADATVQLAPVHRSLTRTITLREDYLVPGHSPPDLPPAASP